MPLQTLALATLLIAGCASSLAGTAGARDQPGTFRGESFEGFCPKGPARPAR